LRGQPWLAAASLSGLRGPVLSPASRPREPGSMAASSQLFLLFWPARRAAATPSPPAAPGARRGEGGGPLVGTSPLRLCRFLAFPRRLGSSGLLPGGLPLRIALPAAVPRRGALPLPRGCLAPGALCSAGGFGSGFSLPTQCLRCPSGKSLCWLSLGLLRCDACR